MAQDKSSFILYTDMIHTVEKLPDEKAGQLLKHILRYVNDLNPETDDLIIQIAFEPVKQSLKRDLKRWESYVNKQRENGKKGGRPHVGEKPKETQKTQAFLQKPKKADSVSVSVSDSVIVSNSIVSGRFAKPTQKDVAEYLIEYKNFDEVFASDFSERFIDYYESNGWKVGRNPMKDWKAAVRTWLKKENHNQKNIPNGKYINPKEAGAIGVLHDLSRELGIEPARENYH